MKKIVTILGIIFAVLLILPTVNPIVNSENIETQNKILIEIKNYKKFSVDSNYVEMTIQEAEELKQMLIKLDEAIQNKDLQKIDQYEKILSKKGLLQNNQKLYYNSDEKPFLSKLSNFDRLNSEENISNTLCYFQAAGKGLVVYTIGHLLLIPTIILTSLFGNEIWPIFLYPYLLILFLTHRIPIRIGLPIAAINMANGTISARGLKGYQTVSVNDTSSSHQVTIMGFTGITIHLPGINKTESDLEGYMFISGFTISAKSQ